MEFRSVNLGVPFLFLRGNFHTSTNFSNYIIRAFAAVFSIKFAF
jgi:hypothetical protein